MPIAKVQLQDGRVARFEVPDGTTPEQVVGFASKMEFPAPTDTAKPEAKEQAKPERGFMRTVGNIGAVYPALEAGAQMLTSSIAAPVAGLAGLAALPFSGLQGADKTVAAVQNALTYHPMTERGKELSETASIPFNALADIGQSAGDVVYSATGSPNAGAFVSSAIQAAPLALGVKGLIPKKSAAYTAIEDGINKGIRPTVAGKQTAGQRAAYMDRAKSAVETIADNKERLVFKDKDGSTVAGELPKNLDQFSQAIAQTKKQIFDEYDSMAKTADSGGTNFVDATRAAGELSGIVNNKNLQTFSPETVQYATSRMEALKNRGEMSLSESQDAIALLNQSLKAYYKDPSPATHGRAMVDELIANNLRKMQDDAITNGAGPGYQALKNKYGALSTIEKEVNQRAVVDARKNTAGLADFSDIFTAGQVVDGLLTGNPVGVARGLVGKGVAGAIKSINNPNRHIKTMFKKVDQVKSAQPKNALTSLPYVAAASQNALTDGEE